MGKRRRHYSPNALRRYLEHLGEPADPPPTAPARAPPQTEFEFGAPAPDIGSQADPTVTLALSAKSTADATSCRMPSPEPRARTPR